MGLFSFMFINGCAGVPVKQSALQTKQNITTEITNNTILDQMLIETDGAYAQKIKIKWFGTAAILIELNGMKILFDPFVTMNNKLYKPPIDEFAAVDAIFVTHGHFDHIYDIPSILNEVNKKAKVYCTTTPRKTLISKGVEEERIHTITAGDFFNLGVIEIRVLKGKHISFNIGLIIKKILNPRIFTYWSNLSWIVKENKNYDEAGEIVVYDIIVFNKRILLMGSLNLDENIEYPKSADLLILPFQGRSDLNTYAIPFIQRLEPKKVLLDHFDDSFPPISSSVATLPFVKLMREKYPAIPVICLNAGKEWIVDF
ncbi:MAG: MBL fold metallo-hydrolase [Treponema sp.]|nr:MBL fold metallo-hydrolase [Treponema sp.]